MKEILFQLFGEGELVDDGYDCWHYTSDDFRISITGKDDTWLVSVDLKKCFNKASQSPIHFMYFEGKKFSRRKIKRIHEATNFLRRHAHEAGQFWGHMDGFDDLSSDVRSDFYSNYFYF
jgi:hypothetical protein